MDGLIGGSIRAARMLSHYPKVQTRIGRAMGGVIPDDPATPFSGALHSPVAGRTDQINTHVPSGSYVIPADIVSSLGEGNSLNGLEVLKRMFTASPRDAPMAPYTGSAGPYGSQMPTGVVGHGSLLPARKAGVVPAFAHGGADKHIGKAVPVVVAGGEFVVHPDDVARIGGGNVKHGHDVLDAFVKNQRAKTIKTLQKLPGPVKK